MNTLIPQEILNSVSSSALSLMQAQYAWGQQQFQQNSQITSQVVGSFLSDAQQLTQNADELMGEWNSVFVPEVQQLVADANDYASAARVRYNMGAAESQAGQAADQQRQAALQDLQSFGIDPSSGRYAALDRAERTQEAAMEAGAGNIAEQQTEAIGRALRSEAIQATAGLPNQSAAMSQVANQALTGAQNAQLANSQEGVNMMGSPADWARIASQAHGIFGPNPPAASSGRGGSGDSSSSGSRAPPMVSVGSGNPVNFGGQGSGGGNGGSGGYGGGSGGGSGSGNLSPYYDPYDPSGGMDQLNALIGNDNGGAPFGGPEPLDGTGLLSGTEDNSSVQDDPFGDGGSEGYGGGYDYGGDITGSFSTPDDGSGGSSFDDIPSDQSTTDPNSGGDFGDSGGDDESFARGGAIPFHRSPSHGRDTDDVPATLSNTREPIRLNAGEFIVPRDVSAWKGEEYFQKLIAQSRKARQGATAKPTMKPPLPGQQRPQQAAMR